MDFGVPRNQYPAAAKGRLYTKLERRVKGAEVPLTQLQQLPVVKGELRHKATEKRTYNVHYFARDTVLENNWALQRTEQVLREEK